MLESTCGGWTCAYTNRMTSTMVHILSSRKKKGMRMNLVSAVLIVAKLLP